MEVWSSKELHHKSVNTVKSKFRSKKENTPIIDEEASARIQRYVKRPKTSNMISNIDIFLGH